MKVWPVIIDSQPSYLRGRGRSGSLLLAPVGTSVLIEHVAASLAAITDNAPLVVAPEQSDERYGEWVRSLCPKAQVVDSPEAYADALAHHELSDALLFIDPRCMPMLGFEFSQLVSLYTAEPRVSHHLVAFDRGSAGTKERVSFDTAGHVRGIQRFYDQATWAFVSGISATMVPRACGVVSDDEIPRSLAELRQMLITRGVPSRDVPIEGMAVDLYEERGMLAVNERLTLEAAAARQDDGFSTTSPLCVGTGHVIHANARMMGPIVVHPDAWIDSHATILGPAVVGAGARVNAGAVVAHAIIGPDSVVPANLVVRDRVWFKSAGEHIAAAAERPPLTFSERLARLSMDADHQTPVAHQQRRGAYRRYLTLKRALDVCAAVVGLTLTAPLFLIISAAIWLESRGPVFYGDKREGLRGRLFKCWKFRTMYTGAHLAQHQFKALDHTDGPHFKVDRDPRVTRVGRVLRALNLDEIPQLFNVLNGEMSLVGPRPSPFRENQVCVSWRAARLSVRPGITGFWQVCRHNRSAGDFHQWIEYDLLYVQHLRFWLDLKILAATILTLGGKAAHVKASWLVSSRLSADLEANAPSPKDDFARGIDWSVEERRLAESPERELVAEL
jgi:lipopolysaccharide/colanic/teichoic acid biosynthesis glycosyltransferase